MSEAAQERASRLIGKLQQMGYTRTDRGSAALMHQRQFKLSRFGVVDTVIGVTYDPGTATAATLSAHDENTKAGALELKSAWPRGLGGSIEMFPVMYAESADPGAVAAAQASPPKRWAIMTAQALVHGPTAQVVLFEGKALWGAAYIKSMRTKLIDLLA